MKKTPNMPPIHEDKTLLEKAGEKAEELKEGLIAGKDKIVAVAEEKFESVKKAIHDYTAPSVKPRPLAKSPAKKATPAKKKTPVKALPSKKKSAVKATKKIARKSPSGPVKKQAKKAGKTVSKKAARKR